MLPHPKQLKIINHKVNKTIHYTVLTRALLCRLHVPFPTYEALITNLLLSNYLLFAERIKCNIPLIDGHKHLPPIGKRLVLFFLLNVKNDRLDASLILFLIFFLEYTGEIFI